MRSILDMDWFEDAPVHRPEKVLKFLQLNGSHTIQEYNPIIVYKRENPKGL